MGGQSSKEKLEKAELDLVQWGLKWFSTTKLYTKHKHTIKFDIKDVEITPADAKGKGGQHIHTLHYYHDQTSDDCKTHPPLVLIHGFSQSAAQYFATSPILANEYQGHVYAIDKLGCCLSTRDEWTGGYGSESNLEEAERYFVDSLEKWRVKMGFEKMIFSGHSMVSLYCSTFLYIN
jgi:pimeloyl-ACP methyl ester carboxylesterase